MDANAADAGAVRIETPWGDAVPKALFDTRGPSLQATDVLSVPTHYGKARVSFHVEEDNGELPQHLRVVMLSGYHALGDRHAGKIEDESTLRAGGVAMGWRVQAYLDPRTGLPAEGRNVQTSLLRPDGKLASEFVGVADRVRAVAVDVLARAAEETPGYAGRLYAAMVRGLARELDEDVEAAERALAAARGKRVRALGMATDVEDALDAATPAFGR